MPRNQKHTATTRPLDRHEQVESLSRGALRHELAKRLLVEIFRGEMPAGTRLIILNLAERFRLSSTPVREALTMLQQQGLIVIRPQSGSFVSARA